MTNEQILTKAIEKAVKNGWNKEKFEKKNLTSSIEGDIKWWSDCGSWVNIIIFSHSFAKAFWGEGNKDWYCSCDRLNRDHVRSCPMNAENSGLEIWQYHLQQMVLKEKPLGYLAKFL